MVSGPYRPHNCHSPGCTRRGEMERVPEPPRRYSVSGRGSAYRPHNCGSPGCTRRGETEYVTSSNAASNRSAPTFSRENRESVPAQSTLATPTFPDTPEADPFKFAIVRTAHNGGLTLAEVNYEGCTNYEGRKILLLRRTLKELAGMESLDPHFLDNHENGLLARFVPTDEGWQMGLQALGLNLQPPK